MSAGHDQPRRVIVPIIDLHCRLQPAYDGGTVTVVHSIAGRTVGAVVDAVSDVARLSAGDVTLLDIEHS